MVLREPDPLREDGNPTDRFAREQWRLVGISPQLGVVEQEHVLIRNPASPEQGARNLRLLDSSGDPILVEGTGIPPTHMWRIDEEAGELVRLPDIPAAFGAANAPMAVAGVVQGEVALLRVAQLPEGVLPDQPTTGVVGARDPTWLAGTAWVAVEYESGSIIDDHAVYTGIFDHRLPGTGITLTATDDGVVAVGLEVGVQPFWPYRAIRLDADGATESLKLASAAVSEPIGIFPDGQLLGVWSDLENWHTTDQRRFFVATDEPTHWWVPSDLCAPADSGMAVLRVMHTDGRMVVFGGVSDSQWAFRELSLN